jgi:hypothetical protein
MYECIYLFSGAFGSSDYVAMISQELIKEDVERNGHGLILNTIPAFHGERGKPRKTSVNIVGLQTAIEPGTTRI